MTPTALQGAELRRYQAAARQLWQVLTHGLGLGLGKGSITFDDMALVIGNWVLRTMLHGEDAKEHGVPDVMIRGVQAALASRNELAPRQDSRTDLLAAFVPCQCCGWALPRAPGTDEEAPIVKGALDAQASAEERLFAAHWLAQRSVDALRRARRIRPHRRSHISSTGEDPDWTADALQREYEKQHRGPRDPNSLAQYEAIRRSIDVPALAHADGPRDPISQPSAADRQAEET